DMAMGLGNIILATIFQLEFVLIVEKLQELQTLRIQKLKNQAARAWTKWEMMTVLLVPNEEIIKRGDDDKFSLPLQSHFLGDLVLSPSVFPHEFSTSHIQFTLSSKCETFMPSTITPIAFKGSFSVLKLIPGTSNEADEDYSRENRNPIPTLSMVILFNFFQNDQGIMYWLYGSILRKIT
ncbi:prolyl aminopeptidase, partial [Sarracenia purpurea var. burkii]